MASSVTAAATLTTTVPAKLARRSVTRQWYRVGVGVPRALLVLERPRLVPPPFDHEVRRRVLLQLPCRATDALGEVLEAERQDVAEALDARLDQELVLGRPKAR